MEIRSPKNGYVVDISKHTGEKAVAGDELLSLGDDEEQLALQRLNTSKQMVEIGARMLDPKVLERQRRLVEINVDIAGKYQEYAKAKLEFTQLSEDLGLNTPERLSTAQAAAAFQK